MARAALRPDNRSRGGARRGADRTPATGPNVARFTRPWTVADVCGWYGRSDTHLREPSAGKVAGYELSPEPLGAGGKLLWWPGDVLDWGGVGLDEALSLAAAADAALARAQAA